MSMSKIISSRRRALGLTQEQLAARLGVTAPAVNKWEKGNNCPDIMLLPPLARLLEIDMNELFCFHQDLSEQEISRMVREVADISTQKDLSTAFKFAEKMLRQYPNCEALCYHLAVCLNGAMVLSPANSADLPGFEEKILKWYERLTRAEDAQIRNQALFMLAGRYLQKQDCANAQRMLEQLPEPSTMDKTLLEAELHIQRGELLEAGALLANAVQTGINQVQNHLLKLAELEIKAGNDAYADQLSEISRSAAQLFEQWNYNASLVPLTLAIERKDATRALPLLNELLESTQEYQHPQNTALYHYIAKDKPCSLWRMLNPLIHDLETNPGYDFLRENPEFQDLLVKYRTIVASNQSNVASVQA